MKLHKTHTLSIFKSVMYVFMVLTFLFTSVHAPNVLANNTFFSQQVQTIIAEMTPEEKVGQLFLITFSGTNLSNTSSIYDLIVNHQIGGVVLSSDMNNFSSVETISQVYQLTNGLQQLVWSNSDQSAQNDENPNAPPYIPLFIGISQAGNGSPSDQILSGLTSLPSQMAIGATWNPQLSKQVGRVMGSELTALGFNFYIGPSLDVFDASISANMLYLGTQTFGGDPYWVGELGKAYIAGLHEGSAGKLAVISKHFPGQGSTDRPPEEEVPTVRKSLEQLKQIELAPFIAVTSSTTPVESQTDGLLLSHIRYQGFQGNIRATTRPVSFDGTALNQLMALESFSSWRTNGGLIVSDNLGSRSVRRFFDPTGETFDAPQVARTAFQAGNDLLYLKNFTGTNDPDEYTSILNTLHLFIQKYQEDSVFAQRVDESVMRIIARKLNLYGDFTLESVTPPPEHLTDLGKEEKISLDVAMESVTLISPSKTDLDMVIQDEPSVYDYMIIFTDVRTGQQCSACDPTSTINNWSFQNELMSLYGPTGTNQIQQSRLSSYSFSQLMEVLNTNTEPSDPNLLDNLNRAEWVIFNILNHDTDYPGGEALSTILAERVDLLRDKNVIVFAFDTPFYLDATEISKVTAYYGLFSKVPASVEVAVRVLMREAMPQGALPVSVSSIRYDLIKATSPDPDQIIPLNLVKPGETSGSIPTPETTPTQAEPLLALGQTVEIEAGVILDNNQNPVPDGTVVRFTFWSVDDNVITLQQEAVTTGGKARLAYRIDRGGTLEVTAASEPATISGKLLLNIESGIAQVIMPTPTPEPTPTPTPVPTQTPTPSPTLAPELISTPEPPGFPKVSDWALGIIMVLGGFAVTYLLGFFWWGSARWGLRSGLSTALGGLLAYLVPNLGFEGTQIWVRQSGTLFVLQIVFMGLALGWLASLVWWLIADRRKTPPN